MNNTVKKAIKARDIAYPSWGNTEQDLKTDLISVLSTRHLDIVTIIGLLEDAEVNDTPIDLDEKVRQLDEGEKESDVDSYRDCLDRLVDTKKLLNDIMRIINNHN